MKKKKLILTMTLASVFAVLTVVNMSLASPKSAGENTLDMLEIMTRAFDQDEGGEGGCEMTVNNNGGLAIILNARKNLFGTCVKKCDHTCTKRGWPDIP